MAMPAGAAPVRRYPRPAEQSQPLMQGYAPQSSAGFGAGPGGEPVRRRHQGARGGAPAEEESFAESVVGDIDALFKVLDDNFLPLMWSLAIFLCLFLMFFGFLMHFMDHKHKAFFNKMFWWGFVGFAGFLFIPFASPFFQYLGTELRLRKNKNMAVKSASRRAWRANVGFWDTADAKVRQLLGKPPRATSFREQLCV